MENSNWLEHIEIVITTSMSHNACSRERQSWAADVGVMRKVALTVNRTV